jgi:hypothetical protein
MVTGAPPPCHLKGGGKEGMELGWGAVLVVNSPVQGSLDKKGGTKGLSFIK